jgi:hypothetical protein
MEFLNPERSLDQLRRRRQAYERASGSREEHAQALQASITRGEIEVSNLGRRMGNDHQLTDLYRQLQFELEMGRGVLKQDGIVKLTDERKYPLHSMGISSGFLDLTSPCRI